MTLATQVLLFFAAIVGGGLNAVVGGGSFVAFPALLFASVAPVTANATTTLSLWPGALASAFAYRGDLNQPRRVLVAFSVASLVGGIIGALLLLHTSNATFVRLVPWLMLFATALFSSGGWLTARLGTRPAHDLETSKLVIGVIIQFIISIYGGYFGGGMGVMMLAAWSLLGMTNIHAMNGMRSIMGTLINGVALVTFVLANAIDWRPGIVMMVGATISGYFAAAVARKMDGRVVKRFVIVVAWAMTIWFFVKDRG